MQEQNKSRKEGGKVLTALILALVVVLSFALGYFSNYIFSSREQKVTSEIVNLLNGVGYIVDPVTGERKDITEEDIADALVNAFLDRYSAYYTAEEYKVVTAEEKGNRVGVGVSFHYNTPLLTKVIGNSPADHAGMKRGDYLVSGSENGGEKVTFTTSSSVIEFLSNCADDSIITLTVLRDGKTLDFSLKEASYVTSYVNYYDDGARLTFRSEKEGGKLSKKVDQADKMKGLDQKTAYISFDLFEGGATEQMEEALSFMESRGKSKLILDLRNNGGGYMTILCDIAAMLVRNGNKGNFVVAYSESKSGFQEYKSGKYNYKEHLEKIVILANENTASAAECLIGALSVNDSVYSSGDIVIEKNSKGVAKTYGKGIMQTTYQLLSGGAFKLTTAKIYWPDKTTSIHGVGVIADGENAVSSGNALDRAIYLISK